MNTAAVRHVCRFAVATCVIGLLLVVCVKLPILFLVGVLLCAIWDATEN